MLTNLPILNNSKTLILLMLSGQKKILKQGLNRGLPQFTMSVHFWSTFILVKVTFQQKCKNIIKEVV